MSTAKWFHGQDFGYCFRPVPARWAFMLKFMNNRNLVHGEEWKAHSTEHRQGVKAGGPTCLLRYYGKFSQKINLTNKEFVALIIHKYIWKSTGLVHYLIIVKLFEKIILWKTLSEKTVDCIFFLLLSLYLKEHDCLYRLPLTKTFCFAIRSFQNRK